MVLFPGWHGDCIFVAHYRAALHLHEKTAQPLGVEANG